MNHSHHINQQFFKCYNGAKKFYFLILSKGSWKKWIGKKSGKNESESRLQEEKVWVLMELLEINLPAECMGSKERDVKASE